MENIDKIMQQRKPAESHWVIRLIAKLTQDGFEGTLMLDFSKGNLSKKYKKQSIEYAE